MKDKLKDRIKTLAEMRLLDIDVQEYLEEIIQQYGERKVEIAVAEAGLLELLGKGNKEEGHE